MTSSPNTPSGVESFEDVFTNGNLSPNPVNKLGEGESGILNSPKEKDGRCGVTSPSPPSPLRQKCVNLHNFATGSQFVDSLHHKASTSESPCSEKRCRGSIVNPSKPTGSLPRPTTEVRKQAVEFIGQFYTHNNRFGTEAHESRVSEVVTSIETTGTYHLSEAELNYGAKLAWRNAPRCVGRIQWTKLQLFDARSVRNTRGMLETICKHLLYATNKGNIRSAITVFPPRTDGQHDYRIWNVTLIKYAGYEQEDGSIIGDPGSVEFTKICQKIGWKGQGGRFDILPLVLQANGEDPEWFDVPEECAHQVRFSHPEFDWFAELGLKWYSVPAVSNMILDIGGLEFTACPFNGWFMSSEIGARNLCDVNRYNLLETIALKMGLDTSSNISLWKDKALIEANVAVLYSFQKAQVTITDHHSASESFMAHMKNEQQLRGGCPADWVWIVPPMSGSACPVFHQEMLNYNLKPSYEYQEAAWKTHVSKSQPGEIGQSTSKKTFKEVAEAVRFVARLMIRALSKRFKATVLYATETGRAKTYAERIHRMFSSAFNAKILCMDDYDVADLEHESLLLVVASTFGNGDPPDNGQSFARYLVKKSNAQQCKNMKNNDDGLDSTDFVDYEQFCNHPVRVSSRKILRGNSVTSMDTPSLLLSAVRFSVFGLGSSAYPNFNAFGHAVDDLLGQMGGERLLEIGIGNEMGGQEVAFKKWAQEIFKISCETFCIGSDVNIDNVAASISMPDSTWAAEKFRVVVVDHQANPANICSTLSRIHHKKILPCKFISKTNLHNKLSRRSTILVRLSTQGNEELSYEPGDHVAIYPSNDQALVERILRRIDCGNKPDVVIRVDRHVARTTDLGTVRAWVPHNRFLPCSVRYALSYLLDITSTPSPMLLKTLSMHARSPLEQKQLSRLGEGSAVYDEWQYTFPNLAEVLEAFPTLRIPASMLLTLLPLLRPRYYSVSSSPRLNPGEVHLTVAVVQYKSKGSGAINHGVCSNWLDSLAEDTTVPLYIRKESSFNMPKDKQSPMILIGPGTGIAPFRSFWQQRQFDISESLSKADTNSKITEHKFGDVTLAFGCRHSKLDNIYKEEKQVALKEGALTDMWTAFSREVHLPRTYVQDLLRKNSEKVYNTLQNVKGHMYVCGDVNMAAGVSATIQSILAKNGEMTTDEAKKCLKRMKAEGRYHEDIFGVTLRTDDITEKLRKLETRSEDNKSVADEIVILRSGNFINRHKDTYIRRTLSATHSTSVTDLTDIDYGRDGGRQRKVSAPPPPFRNQGLRY